MGGVGVWCGVGVGIGWLGDGIRILCLKYLIVEERSKVFGMVLVLI